MLTSVLELPALEGVQICYFMGHRGGELQLDQLTGSCPHVSRLQFRLGESLAQATEASMQSCRLLSLNRLADLHLEGCPGLQANVNLDLDLPPSLTQLRFGNSWGSGSSLVDFFWALREAVKCVGRGAKLHKLICNCAEAYVQPVQWGASLEEQYRRLGGQLGGLRELEVWGAQEELVSAFGAVASSAPSLTRLEMIATDLSHVEVSPICSASLESIRMTCIPAMYEQPPPQVLPTLLAGCTRLREVTVHFTCNPAEGAAVKIRCHCCIQRCILPVDEYAGYVSDVVVKFLPMPSFEQGVQECTLLFACHAAGSKQDPLWGHSVMPGIQ